MLDRRFDRRMRVPGMCQEVVWEVSDVRNEKSKAVAGRPLTGSLRGVVHGWSCRVAGGQLGLVWGPRARGRVWGRCAHSCLEVVWKLSEKCLVLDGGFGRRMSLSGVHQEVVWEVSGVRNEKSKPATGRPLAGLLHWVS